MISREYRAALPLRGSFFPWKRMGVPSFTVCGVVWHAAQRLLTVWCAGTLGGLPQVELYGWRDLWPPTKPQPSAA